MFAPLSNTKGKRGHVHKVSRKTSKIRCSRRGNSCKWGASSFDQPTPKTNRVRLLSDYRNLNSQLKRKPYPMQKIREILLNLEGFQYATSLELNMVYYHIRLSDQASNLCTIILPWRKYKYKRLPMGICNSPDIFQ